MTIQINNLEYCTELSDQQEVAGGVNFAIDSTVFEQRVFKIKTDLTSSDGTTTSTEIQSLTTSAFSFSFAVADVPTIRVNFLLRGIFSRIPDWNLY